MALTTTKRKRTSHSRKRQAQHHRHSKVYLKTYWPYLPMLGIVGLGYLTNRLINSGAVPSLNQGLGLNPVLSDGRPLTRIEVLAGDQTSVSLTILIVVTTLAAAWFTYRHWRQAKRVLTKGEIFISDHPLLDIAAILICTVGIVLSRTV